MLSLANVSVEMAASYFSGDDYYISEEGPGKAEFFGRGAASLGLTGEFSEPAFHHLLHGYTPDGQNQLVGYSKRPLGEQELQKSLKKFDKRTAKLPLAEKHSDFIRKAVLERGLEATKTTLNRNEANILRAEANQYIKDIGGDPHTKQAFKKAAHQLINDISKSGHRAGLDCTFSAPKSVSLACLVGNDKGLLEAHKVAVDTALRYLEDNVVGTRCGPKKHRSFVPTRSAVGAKFLHGTSREGDPQLHTHCVLMNLTRRPDNKWRSVSNDDIYRQSKFVGVLYQNKLAELVQGLGYDIEVNKNGTFELKGYDRAQLTHFSKRRQQVLENTALFLYQDQVRERLRDNQIPFTEVNARGKIHFVTAADPKLLAGLGFHIAKQEGTRSLVGGLSGPESYAAQRESLRQHATQKLNRASVTIDRQKKGQSHAQDLKKRWLAEASDIALNHPKPSPGSKTLFGSTLDRNFAPDHVGERKAVYTDRELKLHALTHNLGRASSDTILKMVDQDPRITISQRDPQKRYSDLQISIEKAILQLAHEGRGAHEPIARLSLADRIAVRRDYTEGQKMALAQALTSKDQVFMWNGVAGSGKTHALQDLKAIAERAGYRVTGLAPDASTAKTLQAALATPALTIHSYLAKAKQEASRGQSLLVVDEAGRLSSQLMLQLLQHAREPKTRILFTGDHRQLGAVEAGNPFVALGRSGVSCSYLNEHRRQKDEVLRKAVTGLSTQSSHGIFGAIKDLAPFVHERKTTEARLNLAARKYLSLPPTEQAKTLLLADTNDERRRLTDKVRTGLRSSGQLGSEEHRLSILIPLDRTRAQLRHGRFFEVGEYIEVPCKTPGLKDGGVFEIRSIRNEKLALKVGKKEFVIDPRIVPVTSFKKHHIDVAVGDKLEWRRNHQGRINREELTVKSIQRDHVTLQNQEKKTYRISVNNLQYLDYAHVKTTYASQGQSVKRVIALTHSNLSRESLYVIVSRAKESIEIITDNKEKLQSRAGRSSAKDNALEHDGQNTIAKNALKKTEVSMEIER